MLAPIANYHAKIMKIRAMCACVCVCVRVCVCVCVCHLFKKITHPLPERRNVVEGNIPQYKNTAPLNTTEKHHTFHSARKIISKTPPLKKKHNNFTKKIHEKIKISLEKSHKKPTIHATIDNPSKPFRAIERRHRNHLLQNHVRKEHKKQRTGKHFFGNFFLIDQSLSKSNEQLWTGRNQHSRISNRTK